jgi:hypothetical protein
MQDILVTYCPLCGTGMVFSAYVGRVETTFAVSGLLYNSDVLLYDRASKSLWSQVLGRAVTGLMKGAELTLLAASHTSWEDWRRRYPHTLVMTTDTGHALDYEQSPYAHYRKSHRVVFPVEHQNKTVPNKKPVLGLSIEATHKAYPFSELAKLAKPRFEDSVGTRRVTIEWNGEAKSARVLTEKGAELPSVIGYWFAWYAFHPDTEVFSVP